MAALDTRRAKLSGAELHRLESLLLDFDRGWDDTRLAGCARELPADCPWRPAALLEMVKIDLEKQWQRGRKPKVEAYLHFYPELGTRDNLPADLLLAEFQARTGAGDAAGLDEFVRRFPRQADELRRLIAEDSSSSSRRQSDASKQTANLQESTQAEGPPAPAPVSHAGGREGPRLQNTLEGQHPPASISLSGAFGRYRILRELGEGGMGSVYLAVDSQLGREVALKVPRLGAKDDPSMRARFMREARASATLNHPNICPVFDVGEVDGVPYLTMMFVEGRPLSYFLRGDKPLSLRDAVTITCKLARALTEAHAKGVVHRDLKPSNIMIDRREEPVIMDFGLARCADKEDLRLTREGAILGTPAYMPPEQVNGDLKAIGPGCDVYSLGVVFYELLTGRLPFEGPLTAVLAQILTQEPSPPSVFRSGLDPRLEAICLKAMAKRPQDRFAAMADFADALAECQRTPDDARQTPPPSPQKRDVLASLASPGGAAASTPRRAAAGRRFRWAAIAAGAAGVLLLGIVIYASTDSGKIKIELSDPNAQVEIKVDGDTVVLKHADEQLRFRAGKHDLVVTGKDFETVSKSFTVKRGKNEGPIKVTLVPKAGGPAPIPAVAGEPNTLTDEEKRAGWKLLFDGKTAAGWRRFKGQSMPHKWKATDGALVLKPTGSRTDGDIVTADQFDNFELSFDWKVTPGANSGIMYRVSEEQGPANLTGPEYQVLDNDKHPDGRSELTSAGSCFALYPPEKLAARPAGEWNQGRIVVNGKHVEHWLNAEKVVSFDFDSEDWEKRLGASRFRNLKSFGKEAKGHIGLQYHTGEVAYRNIKIRPAPVDPVKKPPKGFELLFNGKDLDGWEVETGPPAAWQVKDGELVVQRQEGNRFQWLLSEKDYTDFVLRFEFNLPKGACNSGVALRAKMREKGQGLPTHLEVQIREDARNGGGKPAGASTGSLYWSVDGGEYAAPDQPADLNPSGEWNRMEVETRSELLQVRVNGRAVLRTRLDQFADRARAVPGLKRTTGRIGFQSQTGTVRFRKIEIRDLAE